MNKTINAGKYNKKINIIVVNKVKDSAGFIKETEETILSTFASVKTTKGFTLITNNSDFEKSYTNFTIRYSESVVKAYYNNIDSNRDMLIKYSDKLYSIEYLNNIDEANIELEMQCKLVIK